MTPYDSQRKQHHLPPVESLSSPRTSTTDTVTAVADDPPVNQPPPLHFKFKWKNPTLYIIFLIFCNVLLPCLLYYLLRIYTSLEQRGVVGISSSALGLSSCFDAPFRSYKLSRFRRLYGPLEDGVWWHLDFTMWLITYATLVFSIPLIVGPVVPVYNMFLMSTPMLVLPVGFVFAISLLPSKWLDGKMPFWLSSDKPRTIVRPAVYYVLEDIVAVDFGYKRPWREALRNRYDASPLFRRHMRRQTWYWIFQSIIQFAITAAVTWGASYHFAFGWVLGQFFIWAFVAGFGSNRLAVYELRKEHAWWKENMKGEKGSVRDSTAKVMN